MSVTVDVYGSVLADRGIDVPEIFGELSGLVKDFESVRVRRARKWKGQAFQVGQVPVGVVSVDVFDFKVVRERVSGIAAKHHVTTMTDRGYRNSRSEILVYVQLREDEVARVAGK